MDAMCYPFKKTHPDVFFEEFQNSLFLLSPLLDGISFGIPLLKFIIDKVVFSAINDLRSFIENHIYLFMNTLWKLLVIRTNLDEDWACGIWRVSWKGIWRVEIFLFSIRVACSACRSNAFLSICKGMIVGWLELYFAHLSSMKQVSV